MSASPIQRIDIRMSEEFGFVVMVHRADGSIAMCPCGESRYVTEVLEPLYTDQPGWLPTLSKMPRN